MKKLLILCLGIHSLYSQVIPEKERVLYESYIYTYNDTGKYEVKVIRKTEEHLFKDRPDDICMENLFSIPYNKHYLTNNEWISTDLIIGRGGICLKRQINGMTMPYIHFKYINVFSYKQEKYYVQDHLMYLYKVKMTKTMLKDSSYLYHYTFKGRLPQSKVGDILHKVSESRHHPRWRKKLEIDVSPEWGIVGYNCYSKKGKLMAKVKLISVDGMPFKLE